MSHVAAHRLTTAPDALTKLLPPSEVEIMRLFWQHGAMTVRLVHERIAAQRDLAYTTVMSTMERRVAKGLLQRGSRQGLGAVERDYPTALAQEMGARSAAAIV
jgi:hypothetical protein